MLSIGQLVDAGTALAWRGPMVASALGQLMDGDWGDTELMIVDLPPGTGDIQLSLVQKYRSEEHTSELQSLMRISYAVFCLKKKNGHNIYLVNIEYYKCQDTNYS